MAYIVQSGINFIKCTILYTLLDELPLCSAHRWRDGVLVKETRKVMRPFSYSKVAMVTVTTVYDVIGKMAAYLLFF
jgi:hypothetical protein